MPLILGEQRGVLQIWMGRAATRARTRKVLKIRRGRIREIVEIGEDVHAAEVAGEVVEDLVAVVIEATFERMARPDVRERVGDLISTDRRLARTEAVPPDD